MTDIETTPPETIPVPAPLSYRMVGDMAPLFAAMATATLAFEPIQKDRHVKVVTREKGTYEFDYATLEEVLRCTSKALGDNGLKLWHFNCDAADGAREIHHMLSHSSGAFVEAVQVVRMKEGDGWQQFGSAVTYARRYQVQCMLGVSAEHDDDGNAADGNQLAASAPRKPPAAERAAVPRTPAATTSAPPREKEGNSLPRATGSVGHSAPEPDKRDTHIDKAPSEPATEDTHGRLRDACLKLGIKGGEAAAICKNVTGALPDKLTEVSAGELLAHFGRLANERGITL